jgi:hypothetical protein
MAEQRETPELVHPGRRWRVAFSAGFLDGDSGRPPRSRMWSYLFGFNIGVRFAARRKAA